MKQIAANDPEMKRLSWASAGGTPEAEPCVTDAEVKALVEAMRENTCCPGDPCARACEVPVGRLKTCHAADSRPIKFTHNHTYVGQ